MSNFGFLKEKKQYQLFAAAAIEAERVFLTAPVMAAVGSRKALELAVKWVYAADRQLEEPYRDNLQALIHEDSFRRMVDYNVWGKLPYIVKLGNQAVHTEKSISPGDVLLSLRGLFEFIQWIDYNYGEDYESRRFDEKQIPRLRLSVDVKKIKEQQSLLSEKEEEIQRLQRQIEELSSRYTEIKTESKAGRVLQTSSLDEITTRLRFINVDLQMLGWNLDPAEKSVAQEYVLNDGTRADYVLFGKDGLPLAVIEAKRSSKDPNVGRTQAQQYADRLEEQFHRRPMMFTSNGFETYFWDDVTGPQRKVSSFFSREDLQKLMDRRSNMKKLNTIPIDDKITDRYYQKEAIRAVCERVEKGFRKNLLVMATGTGKTRTASSLSDVLSRGGYVTNVLFLADRTALVKQAKADFKKYLPDMSLCNLCDNKDDRNARFVFSTYPTMMGAIDDERNEDGKRLFTNAHFDLIIIDESHRSIFKKYKAIFEYFDAMMVGLTATPKTEVSHNTYNFFEMQDQVPTYAYDYETAVEKDHVLVPYRNIEIKTKFLEEGIHYDELSQREKEQFEDAFSEDESVPEFIPSNQLNKYIFNADTVDKVLEKLMTCGVKVNGGDVLGKTIIFAQNKKHAEFIVERFNKLYPEYKGVWISRVLCEDSRAQEVIEEFKIPEKNPRIAVSVDMMDTGIDVPECVNLVFFKVVKSKTKFWQMIGRGTRLAPKLVCREGDEEYTGKKHFLIFDWCGNFEFFREHVDGIEGKETCSLSETIFSRKVGIIQALQSAEFAFPAYENFRQQLVLSVQEQILSLNEELFSVRLQLQYVVKFKKAEVFQNLSDQDKTELTKYIAPLVSASDNDEYAKRFDSLMYGLILDSLLNKEGNVKAEEKQIRKISEMLCSKTSVPQVKKNLLEIKRLNTDAYWSANDVLQYERSRKTLRDLIQFIMGSDAEKPVYLVINDHILSESSGERIQPAMNLDEYRLKVNRYVREHESSNLVIRKLTHNLPLYQEDYKELERILTEELGTKEEYSKSYGDTPFGLLIRKIAKVDREAAMAAFSQFINEENLEPKQIAFIHKIIDYIETNGYIENPQILLKPPFDRPASFRMLFDEPTRKKILGTIRTIYSNALYAVP